MNKTEQTALTQEISNEARVLYLLGLRPLADNQTGLTSNLNYKQLIGLLNSTTLTRPRAREQRDPSAQRERTPRGLKAGWGRQRCANLLEPRVSHGRPRVQMMIS